MTGGDRSPVHGGGDRPYDWVGAWSERRAAISPDRVGLRDATTGTAFTYADLDRRANRAARSLRSLGVEPGDRVVVVSRNRPELVDLFFACGKVGAVLAPISHRLAPPETAALLGTVEPALAVVEAPFLSSFRDALDRSDDGADLEAVTTLAMGTGGLAGERGPDPDPDSVDAGFPDGRFAAELSADGSPVDGPDRSLSDPAMLLHTGGSTGVPKATVLTHGSVLWNSVNTVAAWGLGPDDVTPLTFPMFHTGGWNVITVPLFHVGGEVAIAREFDPGQVLGLVEELGATVLIAVPAVLRMMADHDDWDGVDLSTLRFAKSGGGPCRERVLEAWWDRDVDLSQGYGLTECGPNNFAMPDDWGREKPDSVGVPVPHCSTRVVNEDGDPVEQGAVGELELAGPHAADGYWRTPEETEATFGGGWVSTGDLARVDEAGYHYVVGRKKNMFVSGGENVFPPEVEDALAAHPGVEEVVVIPVPDEQWSQVGKAVVQGDDSLTLPELREFLEDRLARFEHPRHLAFVDEMPTSGPSKRDRQAIEERFGGDESA
jgi:fatty-acyl-CoA synthase